MRTLYALLFMILGLVPSARGQWQQVNSNTASHLNDIHFANDSVGFIAGNQGVLLKTVDRGLNWTPHVINGNENLYAVYALSDSIVYAGGTNNLYRSTDGGNTWAVVTSQYHVYEVKFFSENIGFIKTSYTENCYAAEATRYRYHRTLDGGLTWTVFNAFGTSTIYQNRLEIINSDTGYAAGIEVGFWCGYWPCCEDYRSYYFKTTDGGVTWSSISANPNFRTSEISYLDAHRGYALLAQPSPYGYMDEAQLYRTYDGGATHEFISELTVPNVNDLRFVDELEGYYPSGRSIFWTTTQGKFWDPEYTGASVLNSLYMAGKTLLFAIGRDGTILRKFIPSIPAYANWIRWNKDSIQFQNTNVGSSRATDLYLIASGNQDITVNLEAPHPFLIRPEGAEEWSSAISGLMLKAQHDTLIHISFNPDNYQHYQENLVINTTAYNDTTILVNLKGKGVYLLGGTILTDSLVCHDTVWIGSHLKLETGTRMTICPGTVMMFQGEYYMAVYGTLKAIGNERDSIIFTALDRENGWDGITFLNADSSVLEYCRLEYASSWSSFYSRHGGAIHNGGNPNVVVRHCEIAHCEPFGEGGGIYTETEMLIEYCSIHNNNSGDGGGIKIHNGSPRVFNNRIFNNSGGDGGGIAISGNSTPKIIQNLIHNNSSSRGGGIYYQATPIILQNTICSNYGTSGGGIYCDKTMGAVVEGNIIYYNKPNQCFENQAWIAPYYCLIEGGWNSSGGFNFTAAPDFIDPSSQAGNLPGVGNTNWNLLPGSPGIDLGPPQPDTDVLDFDFAGNPRFIDQRIDVGAYELCFAVQLLDSYACLGDDFTFKVVPAFSASGYSWYRNDTLLDNQYANTLLIPQAGPEDTADVYQCRVTHSQGWIVRSNPARLRLRTEPPAITLQPEGGVFETGATVTLEVDAQEAERYLWYRNSLPLSGQTERKLVITFGAPHEGLYKCLVRNACGEVFSEEVALLLDHSGVEERGSGEAGKRGSLEVWPNPAGDVINCRLSIVDCRFDVWLMIYDVFGRKVQESMHSCSPDGDISVNTTALSSGLYLLVARDEQGMLASGKLMISR